MECFVSDLHLTEAPFAGSVSDDHLVAFVERMAVAGSSGEPVRIVFVGDILELLRSNRWGVLWNRHGSAPWSGMCPQFRNFAGSHAEACALEIAQGIRSRYAGFESSLRHHVQGARIKTSYVFGNHDYMVQLSQDIREVLIGFLSLDHDPRQGFGTTYESATASVTATHGHVHDPVNWHRAETGHWALGDAVVLRVVNRFAEEASAALGLTERTHLGRLVHDLENVESLTDIPLYVNWIAETFLTATAQRDRFKAVWKDTVDEFLAIAEFRPQDGYDGPDCRRLRQGFEMSTRLGLAELLRRAAEIFDFGGPNYAAAAKRISDARGRRFVLFGHTHEPGLTPLGLRGEETAFYVNSGCWRRVVSRCPGARPSPFIGRRVASYFLVGAEGDDPAGERYHLHQEWHTT